MFPLGEFFVLGLGDSPMKPGKNTTEFYLTLFSKLLGIIVLFDVISADQSQQLFEAVKLAVEAIVGLALVVIPLIEYIKNRTELKKYFSWNEIEKP
jgi:hypothetical protein